jgi:DNA-binding PadR family transcriptional regulator
LLPALSRLERQGLVSARWQSSENNRRAKYYDLTEKGRAQFKAEKRSWERQTNAIAKILEA